MRNPASCIDKRYYRNSVNSKSIYRCRASITVNEKKKTSVPTDTSKGKLIFTGNY